MRPRAFRRTAAYWIHVANSAYPNHDRPSAVSMGEALPYMRARVRAASLAPDVTVASRAGAGIETITF
jgi:hypothetical protein